MADTEIPQYKAEDFVVVKTISGGTRLGKAIVRDPNPDSELYEIAEIDKDKCVVEIEFIDTDDREFVFQECLVPVRRPPLPEKKQR